MERLQGGKSYRNEACLYRSLALDSLTSAMIVFLSSWGGEGVFHVGAVTSAFGKHSWGQSDTLASASSSVFSSKLSMRQGHILV